MLARRHSLIKWNRGKRATRTNCITRGKLQITRGAISAGCDERERDIGLAKRLQANKEYRVAEEAILIFDHEVRELRKAATGSASQDRE